MCHEGETEREKKSRIAEARDRSGAQRGKHGYLIKMLLLAVVVSICFSIRRVKIELTCEIRQKWKKVRKEGCWEQGNGGTAKEKKIWIQK
jgi:hypothetical protein